MTEPSSRAGGAAMTRQGHTDGARTRPPLATRLVPVLAPVVATLLAALFLVVDVRAQDSIVFRIDKHLEGYDDAYYGDHYRLYDFEPYEDLEGQAIDAARLAEVVAQWEAERARVTEEIARLEADPLAAWASDVVHDLRRHAGLRGSAWTVDRSLPEVVLLVPDDEGVDQRLLDSSRMEYGPWLAALGELLEREYLAPLGRPRDEARPAEVLVFVADDDAYERTRGNVPHWERRGTYGCYDAKDGLIVMHESAKTRRQPDARRRTVLAQFVRAALHARAATKTESPARWLVDGLSEHLSSHGRVSSREPRADDLRAVDKEALETLRSLYSLPERAFHLRPSLRQLLGDASWRDVDAALKQRLPDGVEPDAGLRWQAWQAFGHTASLFVAWLHDDPARRQGLQEALGRALDGETGTELFAASFPELPLAQVEAEYFAWCEALQRQTFPDKEPVDIGFAGARPGSPEAGVPGAPGAIPGAGPGASAGIADPEFAVEIAAQKALAARVTASEAAYEEWRGTGLQALLGETDHLGKRVASELAKGSSSWGRALRSSRKTTSIRGRRQLASQSSASARKGKELLEGPARLGLIWLLAHQNRDGLWSCSDFDVECGKLGEAVCRGRGVVYHDLGVTALALMCLLRADAAPDGEFGPALTAGLDRLELIQDRDGRIATYTGGTSNYDHALATLALVEAVAAGRDEYRPAAELALVALMQQRTPGEGWRYTDRGSLEMIKHPSDTSMTSWALQVLAAARDAGLEVDPVAIEDALLFLDQMTDGQGRTGYYQPGGGSARPEEAALDPDTDRATEAMTAAALIARLYADPDLERDGHEQTVTKGLELLLEMPMSWETGDWVEVDYYYWSAATRTVARIGGREQGLWLSDLYDTLGAAPLGQGEELGSWPALDVWSLRGGRVYATAIMTLALQELAAAP
jgi:hypothetical protein